MNLSEFKSKCVKISKETWQTDKELQNFFQEFKNTVQKHPQLFKALLPYVHSLNVQTLYEFLGYIQRFNEESRICFNIQEALDPQFQGLFFRYESEVLVKMIKSVFM